MQLKRGDARGAALLVENVSVYRGPVQILSNIHWRVEPTAKWGVVGANGCGKSTLLKALVGEAPCTDGIITISSTVNEGYLQQTALAGSNKTIYEEAASAMKAIQEARLFLQTAQDSVEQNPSIRNLQKLDSATARYEAVGGYTQEQKVATVLKGLGFGNNTMEQRCDELSGGWQMRVALARLLLSQPSLLILDEPSNHLDVNARKWLANYLKTYQGGAMVLVTHDVALLQSVSHICEIVGGTLQIYKSCTYTQYEEEKKARADAAVSEYERNEKKAAKLQGFVDRFGASANKASAAQSRVKQLEKMKQQGLLHAPTTLATTQTRFKPTLTLPDPPRAIGETLIALTQAQVGWTGPLVSGIDIKVKRGMKLLLRGPNGAGKSTILAALTGKLNLLQGTRIENEQLRYVTFFLLQHLGCFYVGTVARYMCCTHRFFVPFFESLGVFTQDLAQELDNNARAVDLVLAHAREGPHGDILVSEQDARSIMGRLGLSGDVTLRNVGDLSGGEKARVALSMFCLTANNCILLDEPSNHLDVECSSALSEALSDWGKEDGAVVVVSHDKAFCQEIGFTHIGTVQDGTLRVQERALRDGDWNMFDSETTDHDASEEEESTSSKPQVDRRRLQKLAYNAPKRIANLEELIEETESKMASIEEEMIANGSNMEKLMELTGKKDELDQKLASYMQEWEELEELLVTVAQ
jgi:ATPase subunit of ABC transporter with duplicated ATPase domains